MVDIYMPMVSGLELLRGIRSSGLQTGVILLTAATEMSAVEEALRLGIEDYIIKPFSFSRLTDKHDRRLSGDVPLGLIQTEAELGHAGKRGLPLEVFFEIQRSWLS